MNPNLANAVSIDVVSAGAAAGQTAVNSSSVDMQGWDGVLFICTMGAITAAGVQSVNAAQSSDDSSFDDLEGTKIAIADDDDDQAFVLDIYRPKDRYLRAEVARATQDSAVKEIIAIRYRGRKLPSKHAADVTVETHVSPAEGTA